MEFNLSQIKLSRKDVKRGLKFPTEMNEQLAEDVGIMIGDGCIFSKKYNNFNNQFISVDGNSITDCEYLLNYVTDLKYNLFNVKFVPFFKKNKNEVRIRIYSQGLVEFYTKIIGLPLGKKLNIGIPSHIWENKRFISACLRGIVDTDGTFQLRIGNYPQIKICSSSKNLINYCQKAFGLIGIETTIKTDCIRIHSITKRPFVTNYLYLSGREKFKKYMDIIGFSNPNNILKYDLWKNSPLLSRGYIRKNSGPKGISIQETRALT